MYVLPQGDKINGGGAQKKFTFNPIKKLNFFWVKKVGRI
jgi:hypothetical protein